MNSAPHRKTEMFEDERNALVARLEHLETAGFSDVLDEMGYPNQVLASTLRPLDPQSHMAGTALCVRGENRIVTQAAAPPERQINPYELERRMKPGRVAVIDAGGHSVGGMIGGFIATSLKANGCRGLVTSGGVRDSREIVGVGLPTFCAFVTPVNASRRWSIVEVDAPVHLPGIAGSPVTIRPGDFLLGDADGVLVIPAEIAAPAIEAAVELDAIEKRITQGIRDGGTREQLFALHPRFKHIGRVKP
jgi:4-hydroxy-4-methyl-2-oxoglutarate aldolase